MKQFKIVVLVVILLGCGYVLFFQHEWLGIVLVQKPVVPLGTLISWLLITDYALLVNSFHPFHTQIKLNQKFGLMMKIYVSLSMLWGISSYLLSGNWLWSFQNETKFVIWILYTALLVLFPLIVFMIYLVKKVFRNNNK